MYVISETSEVANTLILIDIMHGHATLREKKKTYTIFTRKQSDHGFSRHISLQSKMSHKNYETKIKSEVAAAEQGNIYWERRLGGLF